MQLLAGQPSSQLKQILREGVLVIFCCVTNHPKTQCVKQQPFYQAREIPWVQNRERGKKGKEGTRKERKITVFGALEGVKGEHIRESVQQGYRDVLGAQSWPNLSIGNFIGQNRVI